MKVDLWFGPRIDGGGLSPATVIGHFVRCTASAQRRDGMHQSPDLADVDCEEGAACSILHCYLTLGVAMSASELGNVG